ncbi:TonB-dependent receptor domain-containing protein [Thiosulfativibrio zosterae]|uniref:TonB-dependent receptor n=1 Tax=Thiosulfativibrio zosterae TaxID=2675053 RepID=A0A6F8PMQ1_9GAMM|nr:TonB-dependent receptor [Thiosulfativibrio zosterae]BBP43348.1 TonB-dependent receptor [Thiosulfativibrio zosterae]
MTMKMKTLAYFVATCFVGVAHAQETTLSTIEVEAPIEKTAMPLEAALEQSGNTEAGSVLRQISGVEGSRMGGIGLDVLIRGQGQSAVNVLVDGGKIEGGCPNRMDPPTHYTELNSFDSIEVIKGVQSLQTGVGGTAGTVILERNAPTFEPGKPYNGKVYAATNSNGLTQDIGAQAAVGNDQFYVVLQGSDKIAKSYEDGNGNTVNSSYKTQQGHIDLGWSPTPDQQIKLSHEISNTQDALYQGSTMDAPKSNGTMTRLSYEGKNFKGPVTEVEVSGYVSDVEHVMDNFSLRPFNPLMKMETPTDVTTKGGKVRLSSQLAQTKLDYGLLLQTIEKQASLYSRSAGAQLDKSQALMWPDAVTEQNSLFVEANTAISNSQNVVYGVRVDQVSAKARNANETPDNTTKPTPVSVYNTVNANYSGKTSVDETNWNGLLRYEQKLASSMAWFGGVSLTTNTADETERFMAKGADWAGNPDLKPEKHLQFDLGLTQKTSQFNWGANVFADQVTDYILRDKAANQASLNGTTGQEQGYVNVDAQIMGAEFDWGYSLTRAISLAGNLAYTQGRNTTDSRNLSNMSPINGQVTARYDVTSWYSGARFNFATEQGDVDSAYGELKTAAWSTVDVFAGYQLNKTLQFKAGVNNLFNHAYVTSVNRTDSYNGNIYKVMEPGVNVWANVEAKF